MSVTRILTSFESPDGTLTPLHDPSNGFRQIGEIDDALVPPVTHRAEPAFNRAGSVLTQTRFGVREVHVPIAIQAASLVQLRERCRALARRVNPTEGTGILRARASTETDARRLYCRYAGGLDGTFDTLSVGDDWYVADLAFAGFDPIWWDDTETELIWETEGGESFFPFGTAPTDFGPNFGGSVVFAAETIDNTGDVVSWPRWRLVGPMSSPALANVTSGEIIDFDNLTGLALGDSTEYVDIDTDPLHTIVVREDGANAFRYLTDASMLWSIVLGEQQITITAPDADPTSRVELRFRRGFLTL